MPFDFFLAQTGAQAHMPLPPEAKQAWMACHFSPYGTGLSNLPRQLTPGSMLILNDRIPVATHDPQRIAAELEALATEHHCSRVLLDFQRPQEPQSAIIARMIAKALPCPVGISECYASGWDGAIFLPPPPLHTSLKAYIAPWQDHSIWLEVMPEQARYTITKDGCHREPLKTEASLPYFDPITCCRYDVQIGNDAILFTLSRGQAELAILQQEENIDCFVGLYQDFAQPEAQATALAQCASRSERTSADI